MLWLFGFCIRDLVSGNLACPRPQSDTVVQLHVPTPWLRELKQDIYDRGGTVLPYNYGTVMWSSSQRPEAKKLRLGRVGTQVRNS
jgi:hypothetical protein